MIEKLHEELSHIERRAWRGRISQRTQEIPAERAYRSCVEEMTTALDQRQLSVARSILKDILGGIQVRPSATGAYLVADVKLNSAPLMRAAGIASSGSGGVIWSGTIPLKQIKDS